MSYLRTGFVYQHGCRVNTRVVATNNEIHRWLVQNPLQELPPFEFQYLDAVRTSTRKTAKKNAAAFAQKTPR